MVQKHTQLTPSLAAAVDATPTGFGATGRAAGFRAGHATGIAHCLEALRPHWKRALDEAAASPHRGVGIASCWYGCGNTSLPNPSTIRIGLSADGRVMLHQGATDIGQGSNTVITQIAAGADRVRLGHIILIVRDLDENGHIASVGVSMEAVDPTDNAPPFLSLGGMAKWLISLRQRFLTKKAA